MKLVPEIFMKLHDHGYELDVWFLSGRVPMQLLFDFLHDRCTPSLWHSVKWVK